ncbi:hypothetical protein B0T24DRAFT_49250 [Lasiosphaeria ovina]|uniref:Uncharacterized protein n=1 Tax=Lasiosphaeria ovina TaxID=92902 RepID=A0AAE0TXU1_9PEZI|nr:hypothetical protein B0T24DRAFT_49250 [Lasiosphaeria ovina]
MSHGSRTARPIAQVQPVQYLICLPLHCVRRLQGPLLLESLAVPPRTTSACGDPELPCSMLHATSSTDGPLHVSREVGVRKRLRLGFQGPHRCRARRTPRHADASAFLFQSPARSDVADDTLCSAARAINLSDVAKPGSRLSIWVECGNSFWRSALHIDWTASGAAHETAICMVCQAAPSRRAARGVSLGSGLWALARLQSFCDSKE